jgi:hypothetical protein
MLPRYIGVDELLDQDMTSYEFFQTLPDETRREILREDVRSFREMQLLAGRLKNR